MGAMSTSDPPEAAAAVAVTAFYAQNSRLAGEILTQPAAHAIATRASYAISALTAENARLRAELDRYQGRAVQHCTSANAALAGAVAAADSPPGTILRATDTGQEWELTPTGSWEPR